jgi:hypothetical protein
VTDTRFDCRIDRPSCEDMVVCLETGWKEDDDDVDALEALEAGCSIVATDIGGLSSALKECRIESEGVFVSREDREAVDALDKRGKEGVRRVQEGLLTRGVVRTNEGDRSKLRSRWRAGLVQLGKRRSVAKGLAGETRT